MVWISWVCFSQFGGGCFTTDSLPGVAILGSVCILFTIGLSWSDSILTGPEDYGTFWGCSCSSFSFWVIWACISKLWGLWHFFGLSLCFFTTGLFVTLCCSMLPTKRSPLTSFFICLALSLYGYSIADLFWSLSIFLTQYCYSFFDPHLSSFQAAFSEEGDIRSKDSWKMLLRLSLRLSLSLLFHLFLFLPLHLSYYTFCVGW